MDDKKKKWSTYLDRIGIGLLLAMILLSCPFFVLRIMKCSVYGVITGSMEPAYGVGGLVIVKEGTLQDLQEGDVVTYTLGEGMAVLSHRIVEIHEEEVITKGDANEYLDPEPVRKSRILGKVVGFVPNIYPIVREITSMQGKMAIGLVLGTVMVMWSGAALLRLRRAARDKSMEKSGRNDNTKGILLRLAGLVLIGLALWYMHGLVREYQASEREYTALRGEIFSETEGFMDGENQMWDSQPLSYEDAVREEIVLHGKEVCERLTPYMRDNGDIKGWLVMEENAISYPIMQGMDNEQYLYHTYSGEENKSGSIFLEAHNSPDFGDAHTIIYGHNMKDGSMFGGLKKYKKEEYYREHPLFMIYTQDRILVYHIFSCYETRSDSSLYRVSFADDKDLESFISDMRKNARYEVEASVGTASKVVTLSTCTGGEGRFVVHGVLTTEYLMR